MTLQQYQYIQTSSTYQILCNIPWYTLKQIRVSYILCEWQLNENAKIDEFMKLPFLCVFHYRIRKMYMCVLGF